VRQDPVNPVRAIPKFREHQRPEIYLSGEQVTRLGQVLRDAETQASEPWQAIAAIRLILLTGCRRGEILSLRWDYIDSERQAIFLPKSKTGRKVVYLYPEVEGLLAILPRKDGNPWVLPSRLAVNDRPFDGVSHVWLRISKAAGLEYVRLHDLRHSYASKGVNLGIGLPLISGLLGHASITTTQMYAHLAADPTRVAGARIANTIAAELNGHLNKVAGIKLEVTAPPRDT
jgi:integrase